MAQKLSLLVSHKIYAQWLALEADLRIKVEPQQPNTPLANDIMENLAKFPHCILLTRVGQFYEVRTSRDFLIQVLR